MYIKYNMYIANKNLYMVANKIKISRKIKCSFILQSYEVFHGFLVLRSASIRRLQQQKQHIQKKITKYVCTYNANIIFSFYFGQGQICISSSLLPKTNLDNNILNKQKFSCIFFSFNVFLFSFIMSFLIRRIIQHFITHLFA